jgi:hypothetical protein
MAVRRPFAAARSRIAVNAEIEGYLDQLLSIRQDAQGIVAGLPDRLLTMQPGPDRWSVVECFSHLNKAAREMTQAIDAGMADARFRNLKSDGPFSYPLHERLFVQSLEPPPRFRARAAANLQPAGDVRVEDVLQEFFKWQDEFDSRLRQADALDLRRARVQSPVASWLRYSLGTAFRVFLAHERRHLWQARHARQSIEHRR